MKMAVAKVMSLAVLLVLFAGIKAEDKDKDKPKEITIEGRVTCAKCDLKETKDCATVVKVKEGEKDVLYWFDEASEKKHKDVIHKKGKDGKVTGTVTEKDGKKWIAVTKVEYKKEK